MNSPAASLPSMLVHETVHLLDVSVSRIRHCVSQLSEEQLWWVPRPGLNSIGSVMRHLTGNLTQWIVAGVPDQPHTRDRDAEFHSPDQPCAEQLLDDLCRAVESAKAVLRSLEPDDFAQNRQIQGFEVTVLGAIMHSVPHFVGHTHQVVQLTREQRGDDYVYHWDPASPRDRVPL